MIGWFMGLNLAGKIGVGLGFLIALLGAVAGLVMAVNAHDSAIRNHALAQGRAEVQSKWDAEKNARAKALVDFTAALDKALGPKFDELAGRISGIDTTAARVSVEIPRAIAAEPRYRDPNCNLTPPVLDQVNAARALSRDPK